MHLHWNLCGDYKGRTGSCKTAQSDMKNGRIYVGFLMGDFDCLTTTDEDPYEPGRNEYTIMDQARAAGKQW